MPLPSPFCTAKQLEHQDRNLGVTICLVPSLPPAAIRCRGFGAPPHHFLLPVHTVTLASCPPPSPEIPQHPFSLSHFLRLHLSVSHPQGDLLHIQMCSCLSSAKNSAESLLASGQTPIWGHLKFKALHDLTLPACASCYPYSAFDFFKCANSQVPA